MRTKAAKAMRTARQWAAAAMAAAALGLAGCGGGGDPAGGGAPPAETPSAIDKALAAVAAAGTAPAVDKAVADAEDVSVADYRRLRTAADGRKAALAKAARAETQLAAVRTADGEVDVTDLTGGKLAAAETAIAALKTALEAAADIADADRTMYRKRLTDAQTAVERQKQLNGVMTASMTLRDALTALDTAGSALTAKQFQDAESALTALKAAITAGKRLNAVDNATYNSEAAQAQRRIASAETLLGAEDRRRESERVAGIVKGITDTQIAAAMTAVGKVTDTSDDGSVTAADNAIAAARTAITNADIPEGDKQLLRIALAMHEGSLAANKASRTAYIRKMEDDAEVTRVAGIVKGITDTQIAAAMTAVGMVTDTSEDSAVRDADLKIAAADKAIKDADIPEAEKAKLRTALARQEGALDARKASRENRTRIAGIVKRITDGGIAAAMKAVGMVKRDSPRGSVADAEKKLADAETAIAGSGLSDAEKAELRAALKPHRDAFNAALAKRKAYAEEMFFALSGPDVDNSGRGLRGSDDEHALNNLEGPPVYANPLKDSSKPSGLKINPAADGGTTPESGVNESHVVFTEVKELRREPAGQLGKWRVTDETNALGENGDAVPAFADRARVYSNRTTKSVSIADYYKVADNRPANTWSGMGRTGDGYDAAKRLIPLGTGVDGNIESPRFGAAGHEDWTPDSDGNEVLVEGTYQGAPGTYRCTYDSSDTDGCRVSVFIGGYSMAAGWSFEHKEGAKISIPHPSYLFFGWWVRENSGDGAPRIASAFFNYAAGADYSREGISGQSINGDATYEGPAAGVYAIHDPTGGKGEAGEFTAKATLQARFGNSNLVPNEGLSGEITDFRLNGGSGDPKWTVILNHADWAAAGNDGVDAGADTAWSINGTKAPDSGNWVVKMIDTTVQDGPADDKKSSPDVALGTFYSEHGTTHRITGAFGARNITKQYDN